MTKTKTMIASGVGVVGAFVASIVHSFIIFQTISNRVHQTIVAGCNNDGRRSQVATNGIVGRVFMYQITILMAFLTQEIDA